MNRYLSLPLFLRVGLLASVGLLLVLFVSPARADLLLKTQQTEIRLTDKPCAHAGTLGLIKAEHRSAFKDARARINGTVYYGCWYEDGADVLTVWEDGDVAVIPLAAFRDPSV